MYTILEKALTAIVSLNVNVACMFWINQPKIPENAKKFRKF